MEVFVHMACKFERGGQSAEADITGVVDTDEYPTRAAIFEYIRRAFSLLKRPDADSVMVMRFSVEPNQVVS